MARRKVSENRAEEIEYRLLELIRQRRAYGGPEIRYRLATIAALASMWNVPLGARFAELLRFGVTPVRSDASEDEVVSETPAVMPKKEPLTPVLDGGILGELGGK